MKIAIFVDGKNFYMGFQRHAAGRRLNFPRLATWLKDQAGGSLLVGCHYYTGIENNERGASLLGFLAMLETQRGYFVHRFPRKTESFQCSNCGEAHVFTREKEVDTTMVADMLRMAAVDAFDAMVLVSGDADHAPAVEGVRSLGKIVFVSTWAGHGLAPRIRSASFDHIDLALGLDNFDDGPAPASDPRTTDPRTTADPRTADPRTTAEATDTFLEQLRLAELHFAGGYVGVKYFLSRWKAEGFTPSEPERQRLLDLLLFDHRVELYSAPDGSLALRRAL